jgi:hypothetical protein
MTAQMLLYRFGPDADFEGRLAGALERLESGGALRILDTLFVGRDAETGDTVIFGRRGDGTLVSSLIDFRLNAAARRRSTDRALRAGSPGIPADVLRELAAGLEPGCAIAAVLVEHVWARALEDAVARSGGSRVAGEFVQARTMAELAPDILSAVGP